MKKQGAHTIAQDRESCAIYGMPRVAVERGFIDTVLPLSEMPAYMVTAIRQLNVMEAG
jgi:two-component system chemotaxis response regulator CheB